MASGVEQLKTPSTLNKLICHIAFILLSVTLYGQDGNELYDHRLNEDKWEDVRRSIRYENQPEGAGRQWTYENNQEYQREQKRQGQGNGNGSGNGEGSGNGTGQGDGGNYDGASNRPVEYNRSPPPSSSSPLSSSTINGIGTIGYVLLIAFALVLMYLIYRLFINVPRDGKAVTPLNLDEAAPIEIPLTELQRLLQEALAKGDFRAAVRIYFIFIIRDLSSKNWIRWEKEKTNFQYLREMESKEVYADFNQSVSYFEIIWYGKREIDRPTFEKIQPDFTRLLDKLGVK